MEMNLNIPLAMKDEKTPWPPIAVKYFRPMLSAKGALIFLALGLGVPALCLLINSWIRTPWIYEDPCYSSVSKVAHQELGTTAYFQRRATGACPLFFVRTISGVGGFHFFQVNSFASAMYHRAFSFLNPKIFLSCPQLLFFYHCIFCN